ncbi:FliH/SctL family protein [Rosenbergiella australiborealis]|uniref:FliH/SctL family protein n=1 Tax=Rosenbergiella australiborealis TaxID=1544696 RepID=UPI001F4E051A|nr:FliH/SctL family protein [Rosenbergiella australiborealis]
MSKTLTPYRFPPLYTGQTVVPTVNSESAPPVDSQQQIDEAKADGFQQGFDEGTTRGFEQGRVEGQRQGFEAGRAEGLLESRHLFEQATAPIEAMVAKLNDFYAQAEQQQNTATLALVKRIAGLVIQQEIATRPELLLSWIDDKLAHEQLADTPFSIRVSDADFQALQQLAPEKIIEWKLHAHEQLARGECIIDTAQQHIDLGCQQRLDHCLSTLEQSLTTQENVS